MHVFPHLKLITNFLFLKNILPCICWIFFVLLVDIGGGEEVRKYPHMCSSSLGAKGGGAVIRNGGGGRREEGLLGCYITPSV